jgi:hypothetical protein
MFMLSSVQLLWRNLERARRVEALQLNETGGWKTAKLYDPVKEAEAKFCQEMIRVFPDFNEWSDAIENMVLDLQRKNSALVHELNLLKEIPTEPKKPRKSRAKKSKDKK